MSLSRSLLRVLAAVSLAAVAWAGLSSELAAPLRHVAGGVLHRGGEVVMPTLGDPGGTCGTRWGPAVEIGALPGDRREVSGFVSSPRHPDVAWMIRDSGNPAALYSFEVVEGRVRSRAYPVVGADNGDWEDLAYTDGPDHRGRLWILDNIDRRTAPKVIYEVREPDPDTDRTASVVARYRWEYPDNGGNHDTEVLFALGGELVVVTKTTPSRAYRFEGPLDPSAINRPVFAGVVPDGVRLAVGSPSATEQLLLTSSPHDGTAYVYENLHTPPDLDGFLAAEARYAHTMAPSQREAGGFFPADGCDIILVSEQEQVWLLRNLCAAGRCS